MSDFVKELNFDGDTFNDMKAWNWYIRRFRRTWMQQWIACCGSMPVVNDGVRREPVR